MKPLSITTRVFRNEIRTIPANRILNFILASYDELHERYPDSSTLDYFYNLALAYKIKKRQSDQNKAS